jgi:hypothetical protein
MTKGQTSLEYLLIIVVALIIVVSVMVFMTGTTSDATNSGESALSTLFGDSPGPAAADLAGVKVERTVIPSGSTTDVRIDITVDGDLAGESFFVADMVEGASISTVSGKAIKDIVYWKDLPARDHTLTYSITTSGTWNYYGKLALKSSGDELDIEDSSG